MSSATSLAASQFTSCALGPGSAAGFRADLFFTDFFGDFTAGLSATVPRGEGAVDGRDAAPAGFCRTPPSELPHGGLPSTGGALRPAIATMSAERTPPETTT